MPWHGPDTWSRKGAGEILLTSMDQDGTKDGYDLPLTRAVSEAVSIPVIASGGAGTVAHLYEALGEREGRCRTRGLDFSLSNLHHQ